VDISDEILNRGLLQFDVQKTDQKTEQQRTQQTCEKCYFELGPTARTNKTATNKTD